MRRGPPVLSVLVEIALRAYPRDFRRRFGDEMRRDVLARSSSAELIRLAAGGLAERRAAARRWFSGTHVRDAVRSASGAPLFTALSVAALALGIGANTAIFTVAYGVLVRPLPYREPDRLIAVWSNDTNSNKPRNPMSPADFADLRDRSAAVVPLESYFSFITNSRLTIDGRSENVRTVLVSGGLLSLLGRQAAVGRSLVADDQDRVVLSDGFWRRRFGGDPLAVGRRFVVDGVALTVAGVMPDDFVFPYKGMLGPSGFTESIDVDMWIAIPPAEPRFVDASGQLIRGARFLGAIGRLGPGVTAREAGALLANIAAGLERDYPDNDSGWKVSVTSVHDQVVGDIRPAVFALTGAAAMILLMACLNVANLTLARAVARRGELALRAALGAAPCRLVQQAFAESLLLSSAGAVAGIVLAFWGVKALVAFAPADMPRIGELRPDAVVLASAIAVSIVVGLIVGATPAFLAAHVDGRGALQEGGRGSHGSPVKRRLRTALVVAEVALALVLGIGAGLLIRSFGRLVDVDPGFRLDHVLTVQMNIPDQLTTSDARRAFYATFFDRIRALPGVISAGGSTRIPLGSTSVSTALQVEGRPLPQGALPMVEFRRALYDYFATMGIPVLQGRTFTADDGPAAPSVAVVNQALARRIFHDEDPVGRHVRFGSGAGPWTTIVGVIGDVRHSRLETDPEPEVYINSLQNPPVSPFVAIRTAGDPAELAESLRAAARSVDPSLTLFDIRTMEEIHSSSLAERRFVLLLIGSFGALALVLASVGVYGVMSLVGVERMQEAGVRLALGAQPLSVLAMIVRDAVKLASAGIAAGLLAAAGLSPLLASQLFGVGAADPLTFFVVPLTLLTLAVLAALAPGWRAMRVDPVRALNSR